MATALIVEDEPLLAEEIREELRRAWPELDVCAIVHDGNAAVAAIEHHKPDVLFLDIELPGLNGLEVARRAGRSAHIVFITAFDHYAAKAFEEGAVDYVLKPLDPQRFAQAVARTRARIGHAPADLGKLVELVRQAMQRPGSLRWISVLAGREIRLITVEDICYFRADNKYVAVVTAESESLITTPLKDLLTRLDPDTFWQIHRGTVVNVRAVRSMERGAGGSLTLHLKQRRETLKVSPAYARLFKQF